MATRGKRGEKKHTGGQRLLAVALGAALLLCAVSIALGVMNRIGRAPAADTAETVRLEILNGTGRDGLGKVVARELRKRKIDVLIVGNADGFDYERTILVARKKKPELESLAEQLGCGRFVEQLRDDSVVDATLIIGADYGRLRLGLGDESSLYE